MRSALVTAEVAMALILLVGAGLMVETFNHLLTANPGYNPKNLLTMQIALPESSYHAPEQISAYYDRALAALDGLSGVRATAASAEMGHAGGFYVEGRPDPRPGEARPRVLAVSGHYFDTMGFPILRGRAISPQDGADAPRVVVLSETMVRHYWPDYPRSQDPVGSRVRLGNSQSPWPDRMPQHQFFQRHAGAEAQRFRAQPADGPRRHLQHPDSALVEAQFGMERPMIQRQ